jgi:hypothetical protein
MLLADAREQAARIERLEREAPAPRVGLDRAYSSLRRTAARARRRLGRLRR